MTEEQLASLKERYPVGTYVRFEVEAEVRGVHEEYGLDLLFPNGMEIYSMVGKVISASGYTKESEDE
jgi:hypothetical protein